MVIAAGMWVHKEEAENACAQFPSPLLFSLKPSSPHSGKIHPLQFNTEGNDLIDKEMCLPFKSSQVDDGNYENNEYENISS